MRPASQHGFTLVEMMIALFIFGLLAAAGASLLAFGVRAQKVATRKLDDIAALYRLDSVLTADLAQAVARPTRDPGGGTHPGFVGASGNVLLQLVRRGWDDIDQSPRASVQRVAYTLDDDGTIARIAYPMLDGAAPLSPATMLQGVAAVTLRYRFRGAWADVWRDQPATPLPDAVELTIRRRDGTVFREMLLVGTGNAVDVGAGGGR